METRISIYRLCEIYEIDPDMMMAICETDLVTLHHEGTDKWVSTEELPLLERMIRLHNDLGINHEGLHTIHHLLERIEDMQQEIRSLRNRLDLYED